MGYLHPKIGSDPEVDLLPAQKQVKPGVGCFVQNKLTMFGAHYPFNTLDHLAESKVGK